MELTVPKNFIPPARRCRNSDHEVCQFPQQLLELVMHLVVVVRAKSKFLSASRQSNIYIYVSGDIGVDLVQNLSTDTEDAAVFKLQASSAVYSTMGPRGPVWACARDAERNI